MKYPVKISKIILFAALPLVLLAGVFVSKAEAINVTNWSNTKTNSQDLIFLANQGDAITFSINTDFSGPYVWYVNQAKQASSGSVFVWTVPNEAKVWNIMVEARDLNSQAVGADFTKDVSKTWTIATTQIINISPGDSIQAAIDSLSLGGVVELAAGTFSISSPVIINKSNIAIKGQGLSTIVQQATADTSIFRVNFPPTSNGYCLDILDVGLYSTVLNNVSIEDMSLVGNNTMAKVNTAVYYKNVIGGSISNLKITKVWDPLCLAGSKHYTSGPPTIKTSGIFFNRNYVTTTRSGLFAGYTDNIIFSNNTVNGTSGWDGINLNSANSNSLLINNTFLNSSNHGMFIYSASNGNRIINNMIIGAGNDGIRNYDSEHNYYANNIIIAGKWSGITMAGGGLDNTYINNIIGKSPGNGMTTALGATIKNNIIFGNGGVGISGGAGIALGYNDVWNNTGGSYSGVSSGVGDISSDPLFADSTNNDYHLKSSVGRWTSTGWVLDTVSSPAIDAGDPVSIFSNEPSPNGGRIDIGAYGNTSAASKSGGNSPSPVIATAPQNLAAVAGNAQVSLSWQAPSSDGGSAIINYKIYRGTSLGGGTYLATLGNILTYTDASVVNGTTYYYQVTAVNGVGESQKSNEVSAMPAVQSFGNGTLSGVVRDASNNPLSGVKVSVNSSNSVITTSTGGYSFTLPAGTYIAIASKNTYESKFQQVTITGGQTLTVNFQLPILSASNAVIWDTGTAYTGSFLNIMSNKPNWIHVPYGLASYTFLGDTVIENQNFAYVSFMNNPDAPVLVPKLSNGKTANVVAYKVYDSGARSFAGHHLWTKILTNTSGEVVVELADAAGTGSVGTPIAAKYRMTNKSWLEIMPAGNLTSPTVNMNQQGIHQKGRMAGFIYPDVANDVILDTSKHPLTEENINPQAGSIGVVQFHKSSASMLEGDFMWILTFPFGSETNAFTYANINADPYYEIGCSSCKPSIGAVYTYVGSKAVVGILNNVDNWKREDVGQTVSVGQVYTSTFTAPYAGKWRVAGVYSDSTWNITDYFSEVTVNAGDRFTFTSPKAGTLDNLVMYLFDRTSNTPTNITTPMDVYRDTITGSSNPTPVLTSISVTPASATISVGATQTLAAQGKDQNGNNMSAAITWSSGNTAIATVSSGGVVTGIAAGTVIITAQSGSITGTAVINISSGSQQVTRGLMGYWKFDENTNLVATDSSGNGSNGAISGAAWTAGKVNYALQFNGTSNYIDISKNMSAVDGVTIESWVKPNSSTNLNTIYALGSQSSTSGYGWLYFTSTSIFWQYTTGTTWKTVNVPVTWTAGQWYHIAVTQNYSTKEIKFYRDGNLLGTVTPADSIVAISNKPSKIGSYSATQHFFNGSLDEVKIYSRALSLSEIQTDMNSGSTPSDTTPPIISTVTSSSITSTSATITWTTNEASDTQIEYGTTTSYGSQTALNSNLVTSHSQNLSGLNASTSYHYRVKSRNAAGNLATGTDNTLATPATAPTSPFSPQTLTSTSGDASISLFWLTPSSNGGSSITSYKVYRGTSSGTETLLTTGGCSALGNVLTCTDSNLTNGTIYYYQATTLNAIGESLKSNETIANPQATRIQGTVSSSSATLIAGATVQAGSNSTVTDSLGSYTLLVPAGAYTVTVTASSASYSPQSKSANVVTAQTTTVNFTLTSSSSFSSADLNSDGIVNSVDFGIMMSYWNNTTKPKSDINQDGTVNSVDFGIMMSAWG